MFRILMIYSAFLLQVAGIKARDLLYSIDFYTSFQALQVIIRSISFSEFNLFSDLIKVMSDLEYGC